jgi:hypothetical protein
MRPVTNGVTRALPELLLGLIALAIALVVTGFVVAHAIRDVKRATRFRSRGRRGMRSQPTSFTGT